MSAKFWFKRFLTVLIGAFLVIGSAQMIKTHDLRYALIQALTWGIASAVVFTGARLYQSKRGQHCAICRDTPEMQPGKHDGSDAS